jgi:hypothetical protein
VAFVASLTSSGHHLFQHDLCHVKLVMKLVTDHDNKLNFKKTVHKTNWFGWSWAGHDPTGHKSHKIQFFTLEKYLSNSVYLKIKIYDFLSLRIDFITKFKYLFYFNTNNFNRGNKRISNAFKMWHVFNSFKRLF